MGLMLEQNLLYIMLTRATDRCHVVLEDLSAGVRLPSGGALREQGLQLGLRLSQVQPAGVSVPAGMCKKQLMWKRFIDHLRELMWSELAVNPEFRTDLQAGRLAVSQVFRSPVVLAQCGSESTAGVLIGGGLGMDTALSLIHI